MAHVVRQMGVFIAAASVQRMRAADNTVGKRSCPETSMKALSM
jgi:hypothetical protein